ncbi:hypothetical protein SHKM778_26610 [Streptomyces sp. KM77-8]|uniref:Polynucleotide kinase-phosphatase ligase domain-containing protein n=1 Tax=Streptomyces haneummycinicus TaxID=3074435 RepID=A0AAT9HG15_9ACTN
MRAGVDWWLEMTGRGGEGMVVKPAGALVHDDRGRPVQPGVKCRGREYLRIIYGPEYTRPENLARLRARFLNHKRSLALREYALGLEALDRLAEGEPCGASTSRSSPYWPWNRSRWTPGCSARTRAGDRSGQVLRGLVRTGPVPVGVPGSRQFAC